MDINERQLINTFVGGMNTDISDSLMPTDLYRYAENLRLGSDENSNFGELTMIPGTILKLVVDKKGQQVQFNDIKLATSVGKYGVVIDSRELILEGSEYHIKYKLIENFGLKFVYFYIDYPRNDIDRNAIISFKFNLKYSDNDSTAWDSHDIVLVISENDGSTSPSAFIYTKSIQIENKNYLATTITDASIINSINKYTIYLKTSNLDDDEESGNTYDGTVTIQGPTLRSVQWSIYRFLEDGTQCIKIFGPCNLNIFTGENKLDYQVKYYNNVNAVLYLADGIHNILSINILNENYQKDDFIPEKTLESISTVTYNYLPVPQISVTSRDSTISKYKKVLYFYCFDLASEDGNTAFSPLSKIYTLYKDNNSGYNISDGSNPKAIEVKIPICNLNGGFDRVNIYRIGWYQIDGLGNVDVNLIKQHGDSSTPYTGLTEYTYIDTGSNVSELNDLQLINKLSIEGAPSIIEEKDDFLFAGNITDLLANADELFSSIDTRSFSSGMYTIDQNENKNYILNNGNIVNYPNQDSQLYNELFNDYVYNENYWKPYTVWNYNGIGKYFNWKYIYKEKTLSLSDFGGQDNTTFKYGEIYRFGVKLYNKSGVASSIKWIADIMFPNQPAFEIDTSSVVGGNYDNIKFKVKDVGVKFTLNQAIPGCTAFEIVRCKRDKIRDTFNVSQGLVGFPVIGRLNKDSIYENNISSYGPLSLLNVYISGIAATPTSNYADTLKIDGTWGETKIYNKVLQFASPEYIYGTLEKEDVREGGYSVQSVFSYNIFGENDTDEIGSYFIPYNKAVGGNDERITKYYYNSTVADVHNYGFMHTYYKVVVGDPINISQTWVVNYQGNQNFDNPRCNIAIPKERNLFPISFSSTVYYSEDANIPDAPNKYLDIQEGNTISTIQSDRTIVDVDGSSPLNYSQWVTPLLQLPWDSNTLNDLENIWQSEDVSDIHNSSNRGCWWASAYPIASVGKSIILSLRNQVPYISVYNTAHPITIANLRHDVTPYRGYTVLNIKNSIYSSFGDVTDKAITNTSIDIFSGDAYYKPFVYNSACCVSNANFKHTPTEGWIYIVPILSEIDLLEISGDLYNTHSDLKSNPYLALTYKGVIQRPWESGESTYTQYRDAYEINNAYLAENEKILNTSQTYTIYDSEISPTMVKYVAYDVDPSDGISLDLMSAVNLDYKYGELTCMFTYNDKLLFWQEHAFGYISFKERLLLQNEDSSILSIGTGDLINKPYYISTVFGMKKHQFSYCEGHNGVYWWDGFNKQILLFSNNLQLLSSIKNIQQYLNSGQENQHPHLLFDSRNGEVVCSCINEESIVYNEKSQQFVSIYKFNPIYDFVLGDLHVVTNNNSLYINNEHSQDGSKLFDNNITPSIKYVVNKYPQINKSFNSLSFGGRFYGGSELEEKNINDTFKDTIKYQNLQDKYNTNSPLRVLDFVFKTPLKQEGRINGKYITNREYDFRMRIPRAGEEVNNEWKESEFGDRLRGKTMQCALLSTSNDKDFSLQYIITKFNVSCS